jgi:LPS export ABC transporter protein LptC
VSLQWKDGNLFNIIGISDYNVENNLHIKFLNPPNPLFQRGNNPLILIILIFVIVISLLTGCEKSDDSQVSPPPAGVEQEIGSLSLTRSQKGLPRWKLYAKSAQVMDSGQTKIEDVGLMIFGDNKNKGNVDIHSDTGEVSTSTYNVRMKGNVKGTLSDGGYLITDEIYWNENDKQIYTLPGVKVKIVYKDSIVNGEELDARPQLETVELKNVVGITTRVEEKQ